MSKNRKFVVVLTVALLTLGTLTAALLWGTGFSPVLAASGDLVAHKSVSSQEVPPGQTVRYTIVLTNTTSFTLTNVSVGDALHSLLGNEQAIDASGWIVNNTVPGYITFTRTVAANSVVTAAFEAVLNSAAAGDTVVGNDATFSADGVDASTTNVVSFTVSSTPDLQISTPENGAVVTTRPGQTMVISGKAWTEFDPPPVPGVPELYPISYSSGAPSYKVDWNDVATADYYVLYESTDGVFDLSTDAVDTPSDSQSIQIVSVDGVYYYRVQAFNSDGRYSRLSNMQSVTVTSTNVQAFTLAIPEATIDLALASVDASPMITVEVSVDGGSSWQAAALTEDPSGSWWNWTFDWTVPEGDNVQQALLARANYVGVDKYETDTITVTLDNSAFLVYMPIIFKYWPPIPYAPTLNDIEIIGDGDDLRVSWTYSDGSVSIPDPTEYELQEDTDANFTAGDVITYTVSGTSKDLLDRRGTYYYRVRGKNTYGYGFWSAIKSISLANTSYHFDDGTEGWEITRSDEPVDGGQYRDPVEINNDLYHMVVGSWDYSILSPMEAAPSVPYTIEGSVKILDETVDGRTYSDTNKQNYGIVFGGTGGSPCPVDDGDAGGCLDHYYRLLVAYDQGNGALKWSLKRIEYHESDGTARGTSLIQWREVSGVSYDARGWNTWRIEVEADNDIKVFFKDKHLATANDDDYINDPYFGVLLESPDFGDVGAKWDFFTVEPSN